MAKLILNPNSIYRNSQANFILNQDALFAFVKSISAVNDSLYGIQPSKDMLKNGFSLSDIFAINPLSSNHSICANVSILDENIDALKFFAQRPFVYCDSYDDMVSTATNPLAVYLTPYDSSRALSKRLLMNNLQSEEYGSCWNQVSAYLEAEGYWNDWETSTTLDEDDPMFQIALSGLSSDSALSAIFTPETIEQLIDSSLAYAENDHLEWVFIFNRTLSWEELKEYYEGTKYLSAAQGTEGRFEIIGSTGMTDEKISSLYNALNESIQRTESKLSNYVAKKDVRNAISTVLSGDYAEYGAGSKVPKNIAAMIDWNKAMFEAFCKLSGTIEDSSDSGEGDNPDPAGGGGDEPGPGGEGGDDPSGDDPSGDDPGSGDNPGGHSHSGVTVVDIDDELDLGSLEP